jgi:hypothetical protein
LTTATVRRWGVTGQSGSDHQTQSTARKRRPQSSFSLLGFAGRLDDGEWCDAQDGATMTTNDPTTEQVITTVAKAGAADLDRAVRAGQ